MVHGERCSAAELADIRPKVRRLVRGPPENSRDHQSEINQSDADVNIDPERPRRARNIIEQKPQAAEEDDQCGDRPVKSHRTGPSGGGATPCFTASLIGISPRLAIAVWAALPESHIPPNGRLFPNRDRIETGRPLVAGPGIKAWGRRPNQGVRDTFSQCRRRQLRALATMFPTDVIAAVVRAVPRAIVFRERRIAWFRHSAKSAA